MPLQHTFANNFIKPLMVDTLQLVFFIKIIDLKIQKESFNNKLK